MNSKDYRNIREAYLDVYENEQLDELSDKLVTAARDKLAKRTNKSVNPLSRRDTYGQDINRETRMNDQIQARNRRTGSNVEPTFTRRHEQLDLYDIILSHLIAEGYADTQEAAEAIMVNMSEDWRESIVETRMDPRGRPASGPMNVYGKSKPNTDPAFQAALKSYREKEAKKTPEQRKAELDAYRNRKMYS